MERKIKGMIIALCFWLVLTEKIDIQSVVLGVGVSILVVCLNTTSSSHRRMKGSPIIGFLYMLKYLLILVKEVIVANFQVASIIISPNLNVSPSTITYQTQLKTNFLRTILSNSITLTPGTLTVSLEGDILKIHCLRDIYVAGVLDSELEKILLKVEECR